MAWRVFRGVTRGALSAAFEAGGDFLAARREIIVTYGISEREKYASKSIDTRSNVGEVSLGTTLKHHTRAHLFLLSHDFFALQGAAFRQTRLTQSQNLDSLLRPPSSCAQLTLLAEVCRLLVLTRVPADWPGAYAWKMPWRRCTIRCNRKHCVALLVELSQAGV